VFGDAPKQTAERLNYRTNEHGHSRSVTPPWHTSSSLLRFSGISQRLSAKSTRARSAKRSKPYLPRNLGSLRRHLAVFVDGRPVRDRQHLSDALGEESRVYVIQALSGG
jgi:sulfur carrier protein ThiS